MSSSDVACDLCGREIQAPDAADRLAYCVTCERFVCHLCWIPDREICSACLQPGIPTLGYHRPTIAETFVPSSLGGLTSRRPAVPPPAPEKQASNRPPERSVALRSRTVLVAAVLTLLASTATAVFIVGVGAPLQWSGAREGSGAAGLTPREAVLGATPITTEGNEADGESTVYTVASGDTLRAIAGQLYGDPNAWRRIYDANRKRLDDPDHLAIGTQLVIPDLGP